MQSHCVPPPPFGRLFFGTRNLRAAYLQPVVCRLFITRIIADATRAGGPQLVDVTEVQIPSSMLWRATLWAQ